MTRKIKRGGKVWINVFPDKPYTKKPAETRMGSGKGNPEGWVAVVKPGKVMFELAGVPEDLAREALRLAGHKLPVKTKFVDARGGGGVMKASEVHNLKDDELVAKLIDAKQEAFNLRFRHATGELENTHRLSVAEAGHRQAADRRQGARDRRRERAEEMMAEDEKKDDSRGDAEGRDVCRPRVLSRRRTPPSSQAAGEEPTSTPPAGEDV